MAADNEFSSLGNLIITLTVTNKNRLSQWAGLAGAVAGLTLLLRPKLTNDQYKSQLKLMVNWFSVFSTILL